MKTRTERQFGPANGRRPASSLQPGDTTPPSPAPSATPPEKPRVFAGRYLVLKELGSGGMGRVFAARDLQMERDVAIKVLAAGSGSAQDERRLEQEARAAGSLDHPNILAVHDIGQADGGPYIVSELLDGETLRKRMQGRPLPLRKALDYGIQLSRGLAAAHEKGLVHRDIKPENLFVTREGRLKILDFGIARPLERPAPASSAGTEARGPDPRTSEPSAVLGTAPYLSPERVRGLPGDHRSDIFSTGVVLYEMLSGSRPFRGDTPIDVGWAILNAEPDLLPSHVPPELERLVWRCLEKDPGERFQSARDLAFYLEALLVPPAPRPEQKVARRLYLKHTALAAIGLVALGAAAVVGIRRIFPAGRPPGVIRQITFATGAVGAARFAPDGKTVVYSLARDGPPQLFSLQLGGPESRPLGLPDANLLALSQAGEMAILLHPQLAWFDYQLGTLGRVSLGGAAVREVLEGVQYADWGPGNELALVRAVGRRTRLEHPYKNVLYETTGWISHPRFSPRKDLIAFLDHPDPDGDDAGSVAVVDLAGKIRVLAGGWKSAQGLAWSPSGREVWFTAAASDAPFSQNVLRAVDLSGKQRVIAQATGRLKLEDVSAEGKVLVTEPNPHVGVAVLLAGHAEEQDLSWLELPILNDLSPDASAVLLTENGSGAEPEYAMFVRRTDGSPPLPLGRGKGAAFSPDGKWVLSIPPPHLQFHRVTLVPIGAGEARTIDTGPVIPNNGRWLPGGQGIVVAGAEPGRSTRLYVQSLAGGSPRPISEEGVSSMAIAISPDGKLVAALRQGSMATLYPVDGGEPRRVPETTADEYPIGFGSDGSLFVRRRADLPAKVFRIDLVRGVKTLWKALTPRAAGATGIGRRLLITPDGNSFAYNYTSRNAHLFLLEGLE